MCKQLSDEWIILGQSISQLHRRTIYEPRARCCCQTQQRACVRKYPDTIYMATISGESSRDSKLLLLLLLLLLPLLLIVTVVDMGLQSTESGHVERRGGHCRQSGAVERNLPISRR